MVKREHQLQVKAERASLARIAQFAIACCEEWRIDADSAFSIQLAIDEAAINIIEHAYDDGEGVLSIRCWTEQHHFYVQIKDKGKRFNPADIPEPVLTGPLEEREIGGLGIYFMRELMDEVRFEFGEDGNLLLMIKYNAVP